MNARRIDITLIRRIEAAAHNAGVRRELVNFEWPECHKPKCRYRHEGSAEAAMSHMKFAIIEAIRSELQFETTTRPDVLEGDESPEDAAVFTLAVLLKRYSVRDAGTYLRAASLIVDAYPEIVPALAGNVAA